MWPHKRTQNVKRVHVQEEHFFYCHLLKAKALYEFVLSLHKVIKRNPAYEGIQSLLYYN